MRLLVTTNGPFGATRIDPSDVESSFLWVVCLQLEGDVSRALPELLDGIEDVVPVVFRGLGGTIDIMETFFRLVAELVAHAQHSTHVIVEHEGVLVSWFDGVEYGPYDVLLCFLVLGQQAANDADAVGNALVGGVRAFLHGRSLLFHRGPVRLLRAEGACDELGQSAAFRAASADELLGTLGC